MNGASPATPWDQLRGLAERPDSVVRDMDLDQLSAPEVPAETPMLVANAARPADPYRPTAALDAVLRGLFLTCSVPGCDRPAWECELDHAAEFDPLFPETGGPTCICNVNPKCKFHHLQKTFCGMRNPVRGFIDEQWIDRKGRVWTAITTPHGFTVETPASGQWLFPQLEGMKCIHQIPGDDNPGLRDAPEPVGASEVIPAPPIGAGLKAVTEYKHAWRRRRRERNARERRRHEQRDGPPPF